MMQPASLNRPVHAVDQAKAAVEQAKLNLSYTVITSPVDGFTATPCRRTAHI